jgi:hypothetical protein
MGKNQFRIGDEHFGSYSISESLETIFWLKILKFFDTDADPDPRIFLTLDTGSGIRDEKISDPG